MGDNDGLYDRFIYNDLRHVGWRARKLRRRPFFAFNDFDKREVPGTGGAYDRCPFDPENDVDSDKICAEETPLKFAHFVDAEPKGKFYTEGGSREDKCPLDP